MSIRVSRSVLSIVVAGCVLLGAGCAGPAPTLAPTVAPQPTSEPTVAPQPTSIKVAFLANVCTDGSWFEAQCKAIDKLNGDAGIETAISEKVGTADAERVIREYVNAGYDLIIAGSYDYGEAALKVAAEYPDVAFAWSGGPRDLQDNVTEYEPPWQSGYYLAGLLAGSLTKTDKVGVLAAFEDPGFVSILEGFKAGVQQVNPKAEVLVALTGSWDDVALGREAGIGLIEQGVDFLSGTAEGPHLGAIKAAEDKGIMSAGWIAPDTYKLAPASIVTTVIWDPYPVFRDMAQAVQAGTFDGHTEYFDYAVEEGVIYLAPYHEWEDKIPSDVKELVNRTVEEIRAGTFTMPGTP